MTRALFDEPSIRPEHLCLSSEWFSPADIVEAARATLGSIDLDPASCEIANRQVSASHIYTIDRDGLDPCNQWAGKVFLNPPNPAGPWWKRLVAEHAAGNVQRAIFIGYSIETAQQIQHWTPTAPLDQWPICIPKKRVRYMRVADQVDLITGETALVRGAQPTHASIIIGVGVVPDTFRRCFSQIGLCR